MPTITWLHISDLHFQIKRACDADVVLQALLEDIAGRIREEGLRMGFASHLMKGETAFLILDDAFQHSDWERRGNCLRVVEDLVGAGWQVFYLTMDDHIRGLFREAGQGLGAGYEERGLG